MKRSLLLILIAVAGCTRTDDAMRRDMNAWTGRPVREFAESNAMSLTDMYNTSGGRTYMYAGYGACRVTVYSVPGGTEYVIAHMASTCPPGSF